MAILRIDPPPATDDINVLRAWVNDFYDEIRNAIYSLDEDNFSDDFIAKLGGGE